jgi:hypothetical protein
MRSFFSSDRGECLPISQLISRVFGPEMKEIFSEQDAEKHKVLSEDRRKLNYEEMDTFYPLPTVLESLAEGAWYVRSLSR